jgi:hypothetical protein
MRRNIIISITLGLFFAVIGFSCSNSSSESVSASKKLYISSGLCYSGTGFTAPTISTVGQMIARLDLTTRQYEVVHDYADLGIEAADTYANGITDGGDGYLYVAVENATSTGNRRVDKILKAEYGSRSTWFQDSVVLGSTGADVVRGIKRATDQGFLVGETTSIERFDATPTRKEGSGAGVAWGAGLDGACATNNTRLTDFAALPALTGQAYGKYIYSHSAAGQHDIGMVSKNGVLVAGSCITNAAGGAALTEAATADASFSETLSANATPTSIVYVSTGEGTGKLLVAYSSSTVNSAGSLNNALVLYDVTDTNVAGVEGGTITNGQILYNDNSYFFGVSAIAYDASEGVLYAASSNSLATAPVGYNIEKFSIDLTTPGATRMTNDDLSSFERASSFNNCVTGMIVAE